MDIKYKIVFHTDWHCGSGLAAGADLDALVVKDKKGMPFIPGKTIKGLIREAIEEIGLFSGTLNSNEFIKTFGNSLDRNADTSLSEKSGNQEFMKRGETFFTNAVLSDSEYETIVSNNATRFMYRSISSTAIGEDGIAIAHSLRKTQVVVPCTLYGEIKNADGMVNEIREALRYVKRLGQHRNRGFGRCTMIVE